MNQNLVNTSPYLRTSREFPYNDVKELAFETNKAYVDIANIVNARTIGLYPSVRPTLTGEEWFIQKSYRQQSFRQVYTFTNTNPIAHGINFTNIFGFSHMYGQFRDSASTPTWYGLIAGSSVAIGGQISFYVDSANINFVVDAGAPTLGYGIIVLEWLGNV